MFQSIALAIALVSSSWCGGGRCCSPATTYRPAQVDVSISLKKTPPAIKLGVLLVTPQPFTPVVTALFIQN